MGKKNETEVTIVDSLSAELKDVFATLTSEEQADVLKMSADEATMALTLAAKLAKSSSIASDVEFVEAKPEEQNIAILIAGGVGLRVGTKIRAYLLGTVHIFSKTVKENWKEYKGKTQTFFYNSYYKFRDVDGMEFGIWSSPTLRILEKLPTAESLPGMVGKNPLVEITYHGKIEGKERLKQEFNFELSKGNSAHVFDVKVDKSVNFNPYISGCINSLNSPTPIEKADGEKQSREDATRANYEKMLAIQARESGNVAGFLAQ